MPLLTAPRRACQGITARRFEARPGTIAAIRDKRLIGGAAKAKLNQSV
ncbi:hypothetical protein Ga0080574_TMP3888 [Salipiger abyssi]|uniref:Uncharacterized protein n=1 Tax=Salipiger abyssi TaxID=1250539 RepID=A0A1P8UXU8_9RHOB|nr:hypothetical protein Ga0080574_TMP3888 [Salipiger abyssi]